VAHLVALQRLRYKAALHPIGFELLPEKFTVPQLQKLYEAIYNTKLDRRNFSRKIMATINGALANAPTDVRQQVVGISIDTTGSTPGPVDETGLPLALRPDFAGNPNGMFILCKTTGHLRGAKPPEKPFTIQPYWKNSPTWLT
jgi:hypothetical protein